MIKSRKIALLKCAHYADRIILKLLEFLNFFLIFLELETQNVFTRKSVISSDQYKIFEEVTKNHFVRIIRVEN